MYKVVRCPETRDHEMVECVETPLGNLIHRCSRFRPTCAMRCTRDCAADLDRETRPLRAHEGRWILDRADEDWIP
jgi:hypothetical protein